MFRCRHLSLARESINCFRIVLAYGLAFLTALSPSLSLAADANRIVIDGRTQTQIISNGTQTDIRTKTVRGANGFNSFSHFQVGQGNTVNLHVPANVKTLLNVVRDSPTVINGTLNGYRNGSIGGHIYFATPNGFLVGKSGVVNVNALTVTTPTKAFTERLIGPGGQISDAHVARLMAGSFPVSPNGNISIAGTINARSGVRLMGQAVQVLGPNQSGVTARQTKTFASTVNSSGLQMGGAIRVSDGGIEIVAAGKARIGGKLSASRSAAAKASRIDVRAGEDITIEGAAGITVSNDARDFNGGDIVVFADRDLFVHDGASFSANAGLHGDGGFIELSGRRTVSLGSAEIGLSAPNGKAGTLLIDPADLVISTTMSVAAGADVHLLADNSITVTSSGIIDTRQRNASGNTIGNSGSITLEAPTITIEAGGQLLTDVNDANFSAGDVHLIARKTSEKVTGKAEATTSIIVNGTIRARSVAFTSEAVARSSYNDSAAGIALLAGSTIGSAFAGFNGGYNEAESNSSIIVGSQARIVATGNVSLLASGVQQSTAPVVSLNVVSPIQAAAMFGFVDGDTEARIDAGANVTAGGSLSVIALNRAELSTSALTIAETNTLLGGTVAYGKADVDTNAAIKSGANISLTNAGDVVVLARNNNDFKVCANVLAIGNSKAGLAIAVSDTNTKANAHIGANIGTMASKAGNVVVEASSETVRNSTSSSTTVGDGLIVKGIRKVSPGAPAAYSNLSSLVTKGFGSTSTNKFGSAIAVTTSNAAASALIGADAGGTAPAIVAAGDVAVYGRVRQKGVRNNASSSINSEAATPTPDNPSATNSISAAVAVGNFSNDASAVIGEGVSVTARNVGVGAKTLLPITAYDLKWHNVTEVLESLSSVLNSNGGIVNNLLTSYANSTTKGTNVAIAGAANYLNVTQNSTAWIARNAVITQSRGGAGGPANWVVAPSALSGFDNEISSVTWHAPVSVRADRVIETANVGGNFSWLTIFGVGGQDPDSIAVGGSANTVIYDGATIAGISEGVTVSTDQELLVKATSDDRIIAISPTSGEGGGIGGNGVFSIAKLNNSTLASISEKADITAPRVTVSATQSVAVTNVSGAVTAAGDGAVGIGFAFSSLEANTSAYIGDNSNDIAISIDPNIGGALNGAQVIRTSDLAVSAVSAGDVDTIAIAGTRASDQPSSDPSSTLGQGFAKAKSLILSSKTKSQGTPATYSFAASGSSAVNLSALGTHAFIDGARIESLAPTSDVSSTVISVSHVDLVAGSGAAALDQAQAGKTITVAIAGAIAVGLSDNATTAYVANSAITRSGAIEVKALSGGEQVVVGLGLALNLSADQTKSRAAAGSISVAEINDRVDARVSGSTISARTPATHDFSVVAYQTSDIGIGAGSLYYSGKTGFGLAFTYASIANPSGNSAAYAAVLNSSLADFGELSVVASSSGRIGAGAATGGYSTNGYAGAIVVTEVSTDARAEIAGRGAATDQILVGGAIINANGVRLSANDTIIQAAWSNTESEEVFTPANSGYNYAGTGINFGSGETAASITAVAGAVQAGKSNIGASIVVANVGRTYQSTVNGVLLNAGTGTINVVAADGARLASVAVGVGLAGGTFAGQASIVTNVVSNTTRSVIGGPGSTPTNTQLRAANVNTQATSASNVRAAAGTLSVNLKASAAGVSAVTNTNNSATTAEILSADVEATGNVDVRAQSGGRIDTTAIGVAVSAATGFGGAGSLTTNVMSNDVLARISGGAQVGAGNNVGVIAGNSDQISVISGSLGASAKASGIGASIVVSTIGGDTIAEVTSASTRVDARGRDTANKLSVDSGVLATSLDLGGFKAPTDNTPDLRESQRLMNGLAIKATTGQAVVANAVTAAFSSSVAIAVTTINNVFLGETRAQITSADINQGLVAGDQPDVFVGASSHSYAGTFGVGAGTLATNIVSRETLATVTGAQVSAPGRFDVDARSDAGASSIIVAIAVAVADSGALGLAGSGAVNKFNATTRAKLVGGATQAGDLSVAANSNNGFASAAGAGAFSSQAAVGGAIVLAFSDNTTEALIGVAGQRTALDLTGDLSVDAHSRNDDETFAVSAVGGGKVGVAGMLNVAIYDNSTNARLQSVDLNRASATGAQSVTTAAQETINIKSYVGGAALGGKGGIGAAANVVQFKSGVGAGAVDSNLNVVGAVNASANSDKDIDVLVFTGGIGGTGGIGAAAGVILIGGSVADSGVADQLDAGGNGTLTAADSRMSSGANPVSVSSALGGNSDDAIIAEISGGNVSAGSISVTADSSVSSKNISAGAGLGGTAGVGAAIAVSKIKSNMVASVSQAIIATQSVTVGATLRNGSNRSAEVEAYAGGGGLYFGAGAAFAIAETSSSVTALIADDVTGTGGGNASVTAKDESGAKTRAIGVAAGAVGIGASISYATKNSNVAARVGSNSRISGYNQVTVSAVGKGAVETEAYGGAAGIAAGADAKATDNSTISAVVGTGSTIQIGNAGLNVAATGTPNTSARTVGIAVAAGAAVGVSLAKARTTQTISAGVDDGVVLSGGALTVSAKLARDGSNDTAKTSSIAGSGALLLGGAAAISNSKSSGTVRAYLGNTVTLPNGDVAILVDAVTRQDAETTGVGVSAIAVGRATADAESAINSQIELGTDIVSPIGRTGRIIIAATGDDTNDVNAIAGAGGIVSGAAAFARTKDLSNVRIDVGQRTRLIGRAISITARHTDRFAGTSNSVNASLIGGSGSTTRHTATITTRVQISDNVYIDAFSAEGVEVTAFSDFQQETIGVSARGGAGGVIAGNSVESSTTITSTTEVITNDNVTISSGRDPLNSAGRIELSAASVLSSADKVSLTTGGAITNASVVSSLISTLNNTVTVGQSNIWTAAGTIDVNTFAIANINNDAGVSTYGLAAVGRADAKSQVTANQTVSLGAGSLLTGLDVVNLSPGRTGDGGSTTSLNTNARADGYMRGLIAVPDATAESYADSNATLTIANGARVRSARNVVVGSYTGSPTTSSSGKGRGFQLGFIPTSRSGSRSNASSSGRVNLHGKSLPACTTRSIS